MPLTPGSSLQLGAVSPSGSQTALLHPAIDLTDTCAQWRNTPTSDGQGSDTPSYTLLNSALNCYLYHPTQVLEHLEGLALEAETNFILWLDTGTDVRPTDRIVKDGQLYEVTDDDSGITQPYYLTVVVKRLRNQALPA